MSKNNLLLKLTTTGLLMGTIYAGFTSQVPELPIIRQSIRNLYFHVPMWFVLVLCCLLSVIYSVLYLIKNDLKYDTLAESSVKVGMLFGLAGITTGALWAKHTWGAYWNGDPKQSCALVTLVLYSAYLLLRGATPNARPKARLSSVYNIFSFPMMMVLLFILPRLTDSLHPGNGGNPAFSTYDLNGHMRLVFYPAVLGWMGLALCLIRTTYRLKRIEALLEEFLLRINNKP